MASDQESFCDLLIIGAGPAGLLAATWAARTGIKTRIIDKRGTKIFNGQADGLQCRTLEIFDSFGFVDRVLHEACQLVESCDWDPDEAGVIRRTDRRPSNTLGVSRFRECGLNQGRIEKFLLDSLKEHSSLKVERGILPEQLHLDRSRIEDPDAYPLSVKVRRLDDEESAPDQNGSDVPNGLFRSNLVRDDEDDLTIKTQSNVDSTETIRAKYVIGCDGAHSWTRRQLGIYMEGEQTDHVWGVLDVIPITNFPDIRSRCAIHSADAGSVMSIPREKRLVRLYVQLRSVTAKAGDRIDRSEITPGVILKAAQEIMKPYTITYEYCDWWTAYQIGQRVANRFSVDDRIFLAGDAVHTHSPKVGQGMNVSMQDTYNLGWKIAAVTMGLAERSILKTYEAERRTVAQALIDFDRKISTLFSGRPASDANDLTGVNLQEFKQAHRDGNLFACGVAVEYGPSTLIAKSNPSLTNGTRLGSASTINGHAASSANGELASGLPLGQRFPSYQVLNQSDGRSWQFAQFLRSDGRFRVVLFAGDISRPDQWKRMAIFAEQIGRSDSFLRRFTPAGQPPDSVIEVLSIHSAPRLAIELSDLPEVLHPFDKKRGWDYDKVFTDDVAIEGDRAEAYQRYGVDRQKGCVVVVRPDQHVAWKGELEDVSQIDDYFSGFLIPQI